MSEIWTIAKDNLQLQQSKNRHEDDASHLPQYLIGKHKVRNMQLTSHGTN